MNGDKQAAAGETYLAILNEHDQILTSAHTNGRQALRQNHSDDREPNKNPAGENWAQ